MNKIEKHLAALSGIREQTTPSDNQTQGVIGVPVIIFELPEPLEYEPLYDEPEVEPEPEIILDKYDPRGDFIQGLLNNAYKK